MPQHKIRMTLEFKGPLAALDFSLHRAMTFVGLGLTTAPAAPPEEPFLPEAPIGFGFSGYETWTTKDACAEYRVWLLAQGFREVCEAAKTFLDQCYQLVAAGTLLEWKKGKRTVGPDDFIDAVRRKPDKFQKLGLPGKLAGLQAEIPGTWDAGLVGHVVSANGARNCLVHGHGVVRPADVGPTGNLELSWRRIVPHVRDSSGERPLVLPMRAKGGETLVMRDADASKRFAVGARIALSTQEFGEVCYSMAAFGRHVTDLLMMHVRSRQASADAESQPSAGPQPASPVPPAPFPPPRVSFRMVANAVEDTALAARLASITLPDSDGAPVLLGSLWKHGPAALVFLRHYG